MKTEALGVEEIARLRSALLAHYDRHGRDLPWRRDHDPYRVLVSEVMLQQTRVETVLGYYEPWLERFPTVAALAAADEEEVLKAWEGLGYYRRARNLHRAARVVRERGEMPTTFRGLRELPGVGEYTAGAVASIAFGRLVPAVDGNVRRVLARLFDVADPKSAWLRDTADRLVDPERPGDWNQALMELGATVCSPRSPACPACPLGAWCAAREAGTQLERPAPTQRRSAPAARFALAVLQRGGRVLVEKRPREGLLGGLWALPEARLERATEDESAVPAEPEAAARGIAAALGIEVREEWVRLKPVRHRFTHLDATYLPVVLTACGAAPDGPQESGPSGGRGSPNAGPGRALRWIDPVNDHSTALPAAQRTVLDRWMEWRAEEEGE
ncbi:MAG: A/G-specific adenine glycosylase [Longimicrobiales bacterium]|nr:A/G-specific adenine glycosylase [Longimicrobiales bacterium]